MTSDSLGKDLDSGLLVYKKPLSIIIEYLVKISKKARILELKMKKYEDYCSDILYAVSIKEDTAYLCLHFTKDHEGIKFNTPEWNSFKPAAQTTTNADGTSISLIPGLVTTEEKVQKKNDVKARSMLLMALPNKHLMTFNQYKDAKTLFAAIQTRFGESLDSIFNRLQKIVSQLAILGENISQEDLNLKYLRSLPSEWNTYVVVWRNKPGLNTMSFDDLYNNSKIVEQEVKRTASLSSQNMAFMSSPSSTNEVNTAYGVSTANTQVIPASTQVSTASTQVNTANLSDATIYAFFASQPNGSQLVYEDLEQIHEDDLEEMDLKWKLTLLSMRTRRGPRNQDRRKRNQDNSRRTVNVEETSFKAMTAIHGVGFDWSYSGRSQITDKSRKSVGFVSYNAVPPSHIGLFSPPNLDLSYSGLEEFQQHEFEGYGPKTSKSISEDISNKIGESTDALLVEELVSDDKLEKKTIFLLLLLRKNLLDLNYKKNQLGNQLTCFVCGSFDHVQADYNYHQREMVVSENNYTRLNYNYSAKQDHPSAHRNIVPRAVLMKTGLRPLNTARPVNTAHPKTTVYSARPMSHFSKSAQSTIKRTYQIRTTLTNKNFSQKVNTAKGKFYTARPNSAVVNAVRGHPQKEDQGYVDSGCSRYMTRSMSYLSDFKEFDVGYVTFGVEPKEGKLLVKELLKLMCDKKNSVLFTDTGCFVLSPDFKLADESRVLLKVSRKKNMYNVDMKNIVPKESLTCLVAKATLDESMIWHRRLGDGPKWLFDIDVLTKSMNYVLVVAGINSNDFIGTEESIGASHSSKEIGSSHDYILMPLWKHGSLFDSSSKNASNDEPQPSSDAGKKDDEGVCKESGIADQEKPENNTQGVNTDGPSINTEPYMFSLGDNATL
ncbi:hypothetical protein Tco_0151474 [Tanacetum coccineum]